MDNQTTAKNDPIFKEIFFCHFDEIKKRVHEGCDLNSVFDDSSTKGWTPLMCAIFWYPQTLSLLQTLVELGADVDQKISDECSNALSVCMVKGSVEGFDYIASQLGERFDVNAKDQKGETVLMTAAHFSQAEMIKCVLKYSPDLTLQNKEGKNALEILKKKDSRYTRDAMAVLEDAFLIDKIKKEKFLLNQSVATMVSPRVENVYKL